MSHASPDNPAAARLVRLGPHASGWVPEQPPRVDDASPLRSSPPPSLSALVMAAIESRSPLWARGLVSRCTLRGLLVAVLAAVAVLVGGLTLLVHHRSVKNGPAYASAPSTAPYGAGEPSAAASPDAGFSDVGGTGPGDGSIVVDVGGRVHHPGLVTLPAGARVADALAAAGGPLHTRDVARLDLASKVSDGQLLLIGPGPSTGGASATSTSVGQPGGSSDASATVDLNTATSDQLDTLPGVGPVTAQKIIDWRSAHNGFASVSQLQQVPGIGPSRYAELQPLVTVS